VPLGEAVAALDSQTLGDRLREVYRTGVPFVGEEWRMELPRPHGEVSERFITFTFSPWRFPDGTMRGVVACAEDSTEAVLARRAAEAESTELRKRYEHARQTLTALQEVLLPAELPVLPRIDLSARYLRAERDTAAGGDWFDAVVLDDGRVALAVGDVVGHGMHASATMGQLRSVLSAYLRDPRPGHRRDDVLHRRPPTAPDRLDGPYRSGSVRRAVRRQTAGNWRRLPDRA
jgi:hypothetical protein